jgi:hypothetical protein
MLTVSHSGIGGGSFYFLRVPEQRLSVATLCNRYGVGPGAPETWKLTHAIADIFLGSTLKGGTVEASAPVAPPVSVPTAELDKYVGTYWKAEGAPIYIELRNGQLAEMYGGKPYPMIPVGEGKFRNLEGNTTYTFAGLARGTLTYHERPTQFTAVGQRRAPWKPGRTDLTAAVGRYCTAEVPVCWSLLLVGERMVLRRPGFPDRPLIPAFADAFSLVQMDEIGERSMRILLQRAPDGSISALSVFRGRVSRLLFERS